MAKFDAKTFNPQAFGKYVDIVPKLKKNELVKSKALKPNGQIRAAFSGQTGVVYATIPMYGRLDGDPLNYDGETDITSTSTTTYERSVVVIGRAKSWVEKDFSEDITGGAGFMSNIARQVSSYWDEVDQNILLDILTGIFSMTGTGNSAFVDNHTHDITEIGEGVVGAETLNTAIQKSSGDKKSGFTIAIMHSTVATNLENLKLLKYLKFNDGSGVERELGLVTWNGRLVIIDDGMPTETVAADGDTPEYVKYTTYVLGDGAFDYEDIGAEVPYAMVRDEKTAGGQTLLYSRQRKVFAPYGISFTKKAMAKNSPTPAELKNGTNWELVHDEGEGANRKYFDHKAIPIARIISKG